MLGDLYHPTQRRPAGGVSVARLLGEGWRWKGGWEAETDSVLTPSSFTSASAGSSSFSGPCVFQAERVFGIKIILCTFRIVTNGGNAPVLHYSVSVLNLSP